ncbi:MAG: phosphatase PAP2 family protein [bacterium]|nr:phosphatase PAP2 family protein [bacterium]
MTGVRAQWIVLISCLGVGMFACLAVEEAVSRWLRELEELGSKYTTMVRSRHGGVPGLVVRVVGRTNEVVVFEERHAMGVGQLFEYQIVAARERAWIGRHVRRFFANDFWIFFEQLGLVWWGVLGCWFLWVYDPARRRYIIVFAAVSLVSGIVVDVIKNTTGKIRPEPFFDGEFPVRFVGLFSGWGKRLPVSFPSGHATQAFVTAVFFGRLYPRARVMLLAAVTCTAVSRVVTGAHWLSDVYAGALLGYVSTEAGFWVWERVERRVSAYLPARIKEVLRL